MSDSLQPHGLYPVRMLCPPLSPGACSDSCPSTWCCCITISSSVAPFFFCLQSFPASGSFPMRGLFASGDQSIRASASVLSMNIQGWFPLGLTGLIFLLSKGLSSLFQYHSLKASVFWCSAFFMVQLRALPRYFYPSVVQGHAILSMNIQSWFPLGLIVLISLLSKGLASVFTSTTVWKCKFFSAQPFLWSSTHICT